MFEYIHKQRITISHYSMSGYDVDASENHGHVLDVTIKFVTTRLNGDNVIIDEDAVKSFITPLNGKNLNNFMRQNKMSGDATIEKVLVYIGSKVVSYIKDFNIRYNTNVMVQYVSIEDEEGKKYAYNYYE